MRTRFWLERSFATLADGERLLALYLLAGPQTNAVGCYRLSLATAAEDLRWRLRAVERRLPAILRGLGWRYEDGARVLLIPEWLPANLPQNPNMVRAWGSAFHEVPACALRQAALQVAVAVLRTRQPSFLDAFRESFGEPLPEPLSQPLQESLSEPVPESFTEPARNDSRNSPDPVPVDGLPGAKRRSVVAANDRMVARLRQRLKRSGGAL